MPTPPPLPPTPQPKRQAYPEKANGRWKWILAGAIVAGLLAVSGLVGLVVLGEHMMKSSSVYTDALARANSSSAVTNALGTPLKDSVFFTGNISEGTTTGKAHMLIPISGPRGSGRLMVNATRSNSQWHFDDLTLWVDKTQEQIDLLNTNQ